MTDASVSFRSGRNEISLSDVTSSDHAVIGIHDADILHITTRTLKIDPDKILNDVKKREIPRFRQDPPAASVATAVQQLIKVSLATAGQQLIKVSFATAVQQLIKVSMATAMQQLIRVSLETARQQLIKVSLETDGQQLIKASL